MASVGGILLGAGIAVWGFAAMRNPMLLSLTRMTEGYYQRLVLDRSQRIGLRNLGVVVGFFGLYMGTGILSGMVGSKRVERVAEAFALLLGLSFVLAITSGLVMFSIQLLRGKSFNWWSAWQGGSLGMINVYPSITPQMEKERRVYSISVCVASGIAIVTGLLIA